MERKRLPNDVKKQVEDIVKRFNASEIRNPRCRYVPRYRGKLLYLDREDYGRRHRQGANILDQVPDLAADCNGSVGSGERFASSLPVVVQVMISVERGVSPALLSLPDYSERVPIVKVFFLF